MSGKSIKTLADQLWKSHGVSLITMFDSGIERRSWNDISRVGHLKDGVKVATIAKRFRISRSDDVCARSQPFRTQSSSVIEIADQWDDWRGKHRRYEMLLF